jgi:hypothetical protein
VLYSLVYSADEKMPVDQHAYDVPGANAPVLYLCRAPDSNVFDGYLSSFERGWGIACPAFWDMKDSFGGYNGAHGGLCQAWLVGQPHFVR